MTCHVFFFRKVSRTDVSISHDIFSRQEWGRATSVACVFSIGKGESEAVSNLMQHIHPEVVEAMSVAVTVRGTNKFCNHDVLGRDLLNTSWSSGINGLEHWKDILRNEPDGVLVPGCVNLISRNFQQDLFQFS